MGRSDSGHPGEEAATPFPSSARWWRMPASSLDLTIRAASSRQYGTPLRRLPQLDKNPESRSWYNPISRLMIRSISPAGARMGGSAGRTSAGSSELASASERCWREARPQPRHRIDGASKCTGQAERFLFLRGPKRTDPPDRRLMCAELIGSHSLRAARRILRLPGTAERPHLSRREVQCLRLVAVGKQIGKRPRSWGSALKPYANM